ncbi:1-acyl-sn-glycerol-3-phosphate acyltransferase gamma-like [Halichondria panicea]|uniref:1-acyl-sn-glycerol-3-phosphate acyltransferase gamma-like n=1 Tax=Halichondria panicea TaxID=6063 RepID=UPI00312B40A1
MSAFWSTIRWIKKRKVTVLLFVFSFIVSGLIINLLELMTLPLYFLNKKLFRQINSRIVYFHWCIIPWALESWAEYDIRVFAKEGLFETFANQEHALCILNHRGDLDWMIGWVFIERSGMLGGTKAIMKDIAKFLPGIGWTFMFMEYPFLKRDWNKDEKRLAQSCKNLSDYPVNMLLCLFAEGTRFTPEKHKASMEFARSRGLPVLKHHLTPRTKGFNFIMNHMEGVFPCIYDVTICYRNNQEPTLMGVVNAEPCSADMMVRRYPITDIDTSSEEAMSQWLINLFKDKDDLVEHYQKHGSFPEKQVNMPKRPYTDLVVMMWLAMVGVPALLSGLYLAWVGNWLVLAIIVAAVVLADRLFQMIAHQTDTAKSSSSYGLSSKKKSTQEATPTQEDKKEQ